MRSFWIPIPVSITCGKFGGKAPQGNQWADGGGLTENTCAKGARRALGARKCPPLARLKLNPRSENVEAALSLSLSNVACRFGVRREGVVYTKGHSGL